MNDDRLLVTSGVISTLGLILLLLISTMEGPTPISNLNPGDIGHTTIVQGRVTNVHETKEGHIFFTVEDATGSVRVAAFREVAKKLGCLEEGSDLEVRGMMEEYRGEMEIIPKRSGDIICR